VSTKTLRFPIEVDANSKQLLGMSSAAFLRDYWQKRPLLIRGAFPRLQAPLTPEDLAGLACEETALSRLIQHDRQRDAWSVRSGPFREDEFPGLPHQDWTLLVQDVDKWDGDVAALLSRFDFLPRWRIDDVMVSFAAPGGSVGAHVDQYDVFLLQGLGRRRWQIDAGKNPDTTFRDDVELKLLRQFHPSHEWILEPGDMLYLPPGMPHHGVALDACLTFSVGMRAPARSELLLDFAEFLAESMPESQRYADPDLTPAADSGEIDAAALKRVARALAPFVAPETATLRRSFGRFITRYRSAGGVIAPPRAASPVQIAARLAAGAQLLRHPFTRMAWARAGKAAELFVDGDMSTCTVATARAICGADPIDAAAWHALGADGQVLAHDLLKRGSLLVSKPRRPGRT
jgi:50S ribosomal protein L16 3-hydroxylase